MHLQTSKFKSNEDARIRVLSFQINRVTIVQGEWLSKQQNCNKQYIGECKNIKKCLKLLFRFLYKTP